MVGDPGIEPGVGLPGGVTVRCRTLQPVARCRTAMIARREALDSARPNLRQGESPLHSDALRAILGAHSSVGEH